MRLDVEKLSFSYQDKVILQDLSFRVADGEFVSILGPSGCGKSTLLNVLCGILKPQGGRIRIDGSYVEGVSGMFAYMPQNDLLLPWRTILDNVCLYGEIHHKKEKMRLLFRPKLRTCRAAAGEHDSGGSLGFAKRICMPKLQVTGHRVNSNEMRAAAKEQMARFGLAGCENKYPEELSGGMRQRAAFLRTTMCEAGIYLLDEPFGALDVITRGDMQDWLRGLCRTLKKTILLVTHDTDEAIYLSDRILIMGAPGEGIRQEIVVQEENRTREWLYEQGSLRSQIHRIIKEK